MNLFGATGKVDTFFSEIFLEILESDKLVRLFNC